MISYILAKGISHHCKEGAKCQQVNAKAPSNTEVWDKFSESNMSVNLENSSN